MASESPIPVSEARQLMDEVFCFGPYAAADMTAANKYIKLPFLMARDFVVDAVIFGADSADDAVTPTNLALAHSASTPSGALAAANRICASVDAESTLLLSPATDEAGVRPAITPGTHNNIIPAGYGLYLFSDADITASALAGLVIHVRGRTRRK